MEKAILSVLDRRRSYVKHTINLGRSQMGRYFQARYSWGQPCDPRRAYSDAPRRSWDIDPDWDYRYQVGRAVSRLMNQGA